MILIDSIIESDDLGIQTEVTIHPDSLFQNDEGNVPAWIGIEYMAQTIAAYAGVKHNKKEENIKLGFLVGTRTYDAFVDSFSQGQTYIIQANLLFVDQGLGSFECNIIEKKTGNKCCYAKINVYEPENTENL
jgi:predicted hotdog family 3-hydroxylacyl-ACP dehydratase